MFVVQPFYVSFSNSRNGLAWEKGWAQLTQSKWISYMDVKVRNDFDFCPL